MLPKLWAEDLEIDLEIEVIEIYAKFVGRRWVVCHATESLSTP